MSEHSSHVPRFPLFRRLWKSVVFTGASGTVAAIWFDEIRAFRQDILGLILLSIMGGALCLLDIFIFKARMPQREDMKNAEAKGATK